MREGIQYSQAATAGCMITMEYSTILGQSAGLHSDRLGTQQWLVVNHSGYWKSICWVYITSIVTIIENLWARQARTTKVRDRIYYLWILLVKLNLLIQSAKVAHPPSAEVALWGVFTEDKDFHSVATVTSGYVQIP